jgi:RNA polymerase sigma-70 factor (ECF subfamily)
MSDDSAASAGDRELRSLLIQSGAGDRDAFTRLYDLTCSHVYGLVRKVLRDAAQSEEVTQEVYLALWVHADRFDPNRSPAMPYLLMQARNRAIGRVRSAQATAVRDDAYAKRTHEREHDSTCESALGNLEARKVRTMLAQLPGPQREAITLAYLHGRTQIEVAGELEAPLGTVKSRIRDGLRVLRRQLANV